MFRQGLIWLAEMGSRKSCRLHYLKFDCGGRAMAPRTSASPRRCTPAREAPIWSADVNKGIGRNRRRSLKSCPKLAVETALLRT